MKALDRSHRIHLGDALSPHCLLRSRSSQGCYCCRRIHHHRGHSGWYRSIRIRLRKGSCHSYQKTVFVEVQFVGELVTRRRGFAGEAQGYGLIREPRWSYDNVLVSVLS